MKYHVIRGAIDVPHYWTEHFTKTVCLLHSHPLLSNINPFVCPTDAPQAQLSLDVDTLRDIEQGIKLCNLLGVPEKYAFNNGRMAELVASDGYIRPFTQMV